MATKKDSSCSKRRKMPQQNPASIGFILPGKKTIIFNPFQVTERRSDMRRSIQLSSMFLVGMLLLNSCIWATSYPWLEAHNKYRCIHGVSPLQWDIQLADVAAWRTENCAECYHCKCQGASCDPIYAKQYAENATCWSGTPKEVVDAWYSEEVNYDYSNPEWNNDTGHFINVVVSSATKVGCSCNNTHCYCDYDSNYGTTASALKAQVFPPVKTEAECTNSAP